MTRGSALFVNQQMLQPLYNKCCTVCHAMLNVEIFNSTRWTMLNENRDLLYSVQDVRATLFNVFEQKMLQDVEPCIIGLIYNTKKTQNIFVSSSLVTLSKPLSRYVWIQILKCITVFGLSGAKLPDSLGYNVKRLPKPAKCMFFLFEPRGLNG